jgi:hypothetical protein
MHKRIITQDTQDIIFPAEDWPGLENSAQAELTSEDAAPPPIELALKPAVRSGWRAS